MIKIERSTTEHKLPTELSDALGRYRSIANLWRKASERLYLHDLVTLPAYAYSWPYLYGREEREGRWVLANMHVSIRDYPRNKAPSYLPRADTVGAFAVTLQTVHCDLRGGREQKFGGPNVMSYLPHLGNIILQDPNAASDAAQRLMMYGGSTQLVQEVTEAADAQAQKGYEMFQQVAAGVGDFEIEQQFDRLLPVAADFAVLLSEVQA